MTFRYTSISGMLRVFLAGVLLFSVEEQGMAQPAANFPLPLSNFAPALEKYQAFVAPLDAKKKISAAEGKQASAVSAEMTAKASAALQELKKTRDSLKSGLAWNTSLDQKFIKQVSAMNIPDRQKQEFLKQVASMGGARSVIDQAIAALESADSDIKATEHRILSTGSVASLFDIPVVYARWGFWKCLAVLGIGVAAGLAGYVPATYTITATVAGNCL
ncbi:MAG TPA: hypothetical protein VKV15_18340 [Bryobacteraceae bacterium]|nr:hypothetical protein [Bryobacteraceae bacterium]